MATLVFESGTISANNPNADALLPSSYVDEGPGIGFKSDLAGLARGHYLVELFDKDGNKITNKATGKVQDLSSGVRMAFLTAAATTAVSGGDNDTKLEHDVAVAEFSTTSRLVLTFSGGRYAGGGIRDEGGSSLMEITSATEHFGVIEMVTRFRVVA